MKAFLFGAIFGGALVMVINSKRNPSASETSEPVALPAPIAIPSAPTEAAPSGPSGLTSDRMQTFSNPLGQHGGLATASMTQNTTTGAAGGERVYNLQTLAQARPSLVGQVVRLRMSRPSMTPSFNRGQPGEYQVTFSDKEGGSASITIPTVGMEMMDLLHHAPRPGLSFCVLSTTDGGLLAVGREWRADTRTYIW